MKDWFPPSLKLRRTIKPIETISSVLFLAFCASATPVVENPSYNFGSVFQGETVEAIFKVQNKGETPISIQKITAPCGCTTTSGEGAIEPGQTHEVKLKVSTELFTGHITKTATVLTNYLESPEITLTVSGEVKAVGTVSPEVINFGTLEQGQVYNTKVKASSSGGFKLSGLTTASHFIKISPSGEVTVSPPVGEFRDRILVTFKSPERTIVKNIPVYGRVLAAVRAEPPVVSFGLVSSPLSRTVKIISKSPIESILSDEIEIVKENEERLVFRVNPLSKDLKSVVTVVFKDGQRLDIPVYGVSSG